MVLLCRQNSFAQGRSGVNTKQCNQTESKLVSIFVHISALQPTSLSNSNLFVRSLMSFEMTFLSPMAMQNSRSHFLQLGAAEINSISYVRGQSWNKWEKLKFAQNHSHQWEFNNLLIQVPALNPFSWLFSAKLQGCLCNCMYMFVSDSLYKNAAGLCIHVFIYIYICICTENIC